MQMPNYNALYVASLPSLASGGGGGSPDAVLSLLLANDDVDFGSAVWFLTTQCGPSVRSALQNGGRQGWEGYLSGCVGTSATDARAQYWQRATSALGVGGGAA